MATSPRVLRRRPVNSTVTFPVDTIIAIIAIVIIVIITFTKCYSSPETPRVSPTRFPLPPTTTSQEEDYPCPRVTPGEAEAGGGEYPSRVPQSGLQTCAPSRCFLVSPSTQGRVPARTAVSDHTRPRAQASGVRPLKQEPRGGTHFSPKGSSQPHAS